MEYRSYEEFLKLLKKLKVRCITFETYDQNEATVSILVELKDGNKFRSHVLSCSKNFLTELCYKHRTHVSFQASNSLSILLKKFFTPIFWGVVATMSTFLGIVLFLITANHLGSSHHESEPTHPLPGFVALADKNNATHKEEDAISLDDVVVDASMRQELLEIGEYLHHPEKFKQLGVTPPKGLLLTGAPGTGKTLLAKALAHSISANFIAVKGSEFQKKWVGEGAKMVRDLFRYAREHSPCLIYIDELDELGRNRDHYRYYEGSTFYTLSLNQLLVELDGFNERDKIFVIGSTNIPRQLDPALLRPGRLERTLTFNLPTPEQREKILRQWALRRKVPLKDWSLCTLFAKKTVQWSGAKLVNLLNEAAIEAARKAKAQVDEEDFNAAFWRIEIGSRQSSSAEKAVLKQTAIHEAGHLLCRWALEQQVYSEKTRARGDEIVYYASILPTNSGALGLITFSPSEDLLKLPEKWFFETYLITCLGGREAEKLFYSSKHFTPGASADFSQAKQALLEYIGLGFSSNSDFYGNCIELTDSDCDLRTFKAYSPELQKALHAEVSLLWNRMQSKCATFLKRNQSVLIALSELLLEKETLMHEDIVKFFETHAVYYYCLEG